MSRLEDLQAQQAEILAFLKTVDERVEKLFDVVNSPDIPEEAAAALKAGLDEIKAAAEKISVDDEPTSDE